MKKLIVLVIASLWFSIALADSDWRVDTMWNYIVDIIVPALQELEGDVAALEESGTVSFPTGNTRGGTNALGSNTNGNFNSAYGVDALTSNTTGGFNTATGYQALFSNNGENNTATGYQALFSNISGLFVGGDNNTANGYQALYNNTTGGENTAGGYQSMYSNTTGLFNTANGSFSLYNNDTGAENTAFGYRALYSNTTGSYNTAFGYRGLNGNTTGDYNTAAGYHALHRNTTGDQNTASGYRALFRNTTGEFNVAVGYQAGSAYTTGSDNIAIGNVGVSGESATIRIGNSLAGTAQTRAFVAGIHGVTTGINDAVAVMIDSAGQLGTISSSRRYKEDIDDMAGASEALLRLRPVTFRYKDAFGNGDSPIQYGLIAEEVADVFPDLVVRNEAGDPETVKYHLLATLLLNELQKQQRINDQQEAELARFRNQEAELAALTERVAELQSLAFRLAQLEEAGELPFQVANQQ